jgi:hypothetical protein
MLHVLYKPSKHSIGRSVKHTAPTASRNAEVTGTCIVKGLLLFYVKLKQDKLYNHDHNMGMMQFQSALQYRQ